MIAKFDSLSRIEKPKIFVCPPGTKLVDNKLTSVLGILPNSSDEELISNFNATSSFNFRTYYSKEIYANASSSITGEAIVGEAIVGLEYPEILYDKLKSKLLLYLDGIGFFIINDVEEGIEGNLIYKDISCSSCEQEIENRKVPFIQDGTYKFFDLLATLVKALPLWEIGNIDENISNRSRSFEDISEDTNILSFMLNDMQDAYECIFVFDTTRRYIYVYDQNNYIHRTQIHLTNDNLVESIRIREDSNDIYTALTVLGNDDVVISPINPLGNNTIYNFNYYIDWMSEDLKIKVREWNALYESSKETYYQLNLDYYDLLDDHTNESEEVSKLEIQLEIFNRCKDNIVAESGFDNTVAFFIDSSDYSQLIQSVTEYNKVIEEYGGTPIAINKSFVESLTIVNDKTTISKTPSGISGHEITGVYIKDELGRYIQELKQSDEVSENTFTYNSSTKEISFLPGEFADNTAVGVFYSTPDAEDYELVVLVGELLSKVESAINEVLENLSQARGTVVEIQAAIDEKKTAINGIVSRLKLQTFFTIDGDSSLFNELSNYMFEGSYTDDYVVITDIMTYEDKFKQMKTLYDRALLNLKKISEPTQEFDLDVNNFIFEKAFSKWTEQLETGCLINVEIKPNDIAELFLSSFTVNYEDKTLSMTFGNRYNKYDVKSLFEDTLGQISKTSNSVSFIKDVIYPVKDGEINRMKDALQATRNITAGAAFASTNNKVTIDDNGYTGRRINENGDIDPEQIKIINNSITFTDDAWKTCKTAVGKIVTADGVTTYGINAETLIGNLIIGNQLQIYDNEGRPFIEALDEQIRITMDGEYGTWITVKDEGVRIGSTKSNAEVYSLQDNDSYTFYRSGGGESGDDDAEALLSIETSGISAPSINVSSQLSFEGEVEDNPHHREWVIRKGLYIDGVGHNLTDYWIGG